MKLLVWLLQQMSSNTTETFYSALVLVNLLTASCTCSWLFLYEALLEMQADSC